MTPKPAVALRFALASAGAAIVLLLANQPVFPQGLQGLQFLQGPPRIPAELRDRAARRGRIRVIVELNVPGGHVAEGGLPNTSARLGQRQRLNALQARLLSRLPSAAHRVIHRFETVPFVALEVDARALNALESAGVDVIRVMDDRIVRPVLSDSVPLIQGDQAWALGYDGTGTTVAVIDTGVDSTHPFLAGKIVEEACYSGSDPGISSSFCPNGLPQQIGPGAAAPCPMDDCFHGTHVAGIAAGNGDHAGVAFSGVAKNANIMAVQVFSQIDDYVSCGGAPPCLGGFTSDILAGLERVFIVAPQLNIAAVNMSLGEGQFYSTCDDEPYKAVIDNLRSIGVATVAAAGNSGYTSSMLTPACVSSAVSVGATDKADHVAYFSNVAPFLSLFAPGDSILSSVLGGDYEFVSGTSMAAPHVAGAWAVVKQAIPGASVTDVLAALRQTGLPITDTRHGGTVTAPRLKIFEALASLNAITNPSPAVTAISPSKARAGDPSFSMTVTGSGFDAFSVVRWNGTDRPTTVIGPATLRASIPATDLVTVATADVTVFTPEPGGGTSSPLTFVIDPPPTLTVSAAVVTVGGSETVTLHDGFGGHNDWLGLAASGTSNTSVIQYAWIADGVTTTAWTVSMPATAGQYEFRLFRDGGYTRAATSPAITVEAAPNPAPVVGGLSPNNAVAGGPAFTLFVNGSGFVSGSIVRWNGGDRPTIFVSATQLRASIDAADTATVGTAQVSVSTPAPGGGTSGASTFAINTPPSLTVSTGTAPGGTAVTVTLLNGLGGSNDWLALAPTTAADTSYLQWTTVGAGITTRTWTVTMPAATGTYEFRLFLNGYYTRAATSPPVAVTVPAQPPALAVSTGSATPGAPVTVTLTNGLGGATDWLVLAPTNAADTSYLQWTTVGANVTTRTWTVTMPVTAGTYEFRLFLNGQFTRAATSPPVIVTTPQPPSLAVSASSASPGAPITVTLTNGPGGANDWLVLTPTSAANTSYLQWTWVGSGVTTRTWTVTMPVTAGTYEFRLFLNGGYTRAATSAPVTVTTPPPPSLTVSAVSAAPGAPVTVTLTNGAGGVHDWLVLAKTTAADTSYLQWTWVGAGVTTRTWTVTMPATTGPYEFRLFLNGYYIRAATSPTVTVGSP